MMETMARRCRSISSSWKRVELFWNQFEILEGPLVVRLAEPADLANLANSSAFCGYLILVGVVGYFGDRVFSFPMSWT
jgi:hypothetical protein